MENTYNPSYKEDLRSQKIADAFESCIYSLALGTSMEIMADILQNHIDDNDFESAEGFRLAIGEWHFALYNKMNASLVNPYGYEE